MTRHWGVAQKWEPRRRRDVWCARCMLVVLAMIGAAALLAVFGPGLVALLLSPPR